MTEPVTKPELHFLSYPTRASRQPAGLSRRQVHRLEDPRVGGESSQFFHVARLWIVSARYRHQYARAELRLSHTVPHRRDYEGGS